jgi:hypothetical protein
VPWQGTDSSGILEVVRLPVSISGVGVVPRVDVVISQTLCLQSVICGTGLPPPIPLQMCPLYMRYRVILERAFVRVRLIHGRRQVNRTSID